MKFKKAEREKLLAKIIVALGSALSGGGATNVIIFAIPGAALTSLSVRPLSSPRHLFIVLLNSNS